MDGVVTFSTVQLVISVLVFAVTVAGTLLSGAIWLDKRRREGDRDLHVKVDAASAALAMSTAKIREEYVPRTEFQRHQDKIDDEIRGLRLDIKGEFSRLNDRFDRLLASRSSDGAD
jgi:hypothetical protein